MPFVKPRWYRALAALGVGLLIAVALPAQQPVDAPLASSYALPVGVAFHGPDLMFVYERRGVVQVVDHGTRLGSPLLDISDEVGGWRDFGLLGFALDPDFASNGFYYLSYVVDRHHLLHFGTPSYSATSNEYYAATITRVTRYTADVATGFTTTVPGSRLVLFGESPGNGAPITYESHGACQLAFGRDGTLLAAFGDGASYLLPADCGSDPQTYYQQALADGILRPEENVGAFRAQMLNSFSGKILRLDPATGDGLPSNPFFDPAQPRSPRSRIWALGLRNPFRLTVRPGTGSLDPALGRPGTIYLGDVGWYSREELNIVSHGGDNYGWPMFEGIDPNPLFFPHLVINGDTPNPQAGINGCTESHFHFQDLLLQATESHSVLFPNPCNQQIGIAATTPTFLHTPPVLDWDHAVDDARVPVFENGVLVARQLGTPAAGIPGPQFHGGCSVGGCWHSGLSFPQAFGPGYYHADFAEGWIRRFDFDAQDELVEVHDLIGTPYPMQLIESPVDHGLIYVNLPQQLREIRFGVEPAPVSLPVANATYGTGTLDVQFDARASYDPEDQPLTYLWDLGHGRTSTAAQLGYQFRSFGSPTAESVQLTVTDSHGVSDTTTVPIAIDNTPPRVAITSFKNGDTYSLAGPTTLTLTADVADAEHGPTQLSYSWRTALHHNTHVHPEATDTQPATTTVLSPTPADHEFFAYSVELTVTDAGGLSTSVRNWLFPDTSGASTSVLLTSPASGDHLAPGAPVEFRALTTGSVQRVEYYVEGELVGVANTPPYAYSWTPTAGGTLTAMALVIATDASSSNTRGIPFVVDEPTITKVRGRGPAADAVESASQASAPILTDPMLVLGNDGTPWLTGLQFALPMLPTGARVQEAWVEFTAAQSDTGKSHLQIRSDLQPSSAPITRTLKNLQNRKLGPAVAWTPPDWLAGASGPDQATPDLSALLQPLVDHPKWNHSLLLLLQGSGMRHAVTWNGNPLVGPLCTIRWLPPLPTANVDPVVADANEDIGTGSVNDSDSMLHLGHVQGLAHLTALQFALPLPSGATIESARVQFTAAGADTGMAILTIRVEATDDASPLAAAPFDISTRPQTQDSVRWYPPEWPAPGAAGNEQRTPELAELVQQILQRPGWQAGQKIVLILDGTGGRTAFSRDASPADAPTLDLSYKLP